MTPNNGPILRFFKFIFEYEGNIKCDFMHISCFPPTSTSCDRNLLESGDGIYLVTFFNPRWKYNRSQLESIYAIVYIEIKGGSIRIGEPDLGKMKCKPKLDISKYKNVERDFLKKFGKGLVFAIKLVAKFI